MKTHSLHIKMGALILLVEATQTGHLYHFAARGGFLVFEFYFKF